MACHARLDSEGLHVRGLVVGVGGEPLYEARDVGDPRAAAQLGRTIAERLLAMGAAEILARAQHG
jgi:porphobilinogen deaminase